MGFLRNSAKRVVCALFLLVTVQSAAAQEQAWVQIAARSSTGSAQQTAAGFQAQLGLPVQAFSLRSGWIAIAIGPQDPQAAQAMLQQLKAARTIPADSFLSDGRGYRQRIWPGDDTAALPQLSLQTPGSLGLQSDTARQTGPAPAEAVVDPETPTQARRSESALSRDERLALQQALSWFGVYRGDFDGLIGPGTRQSMGAWQRQVGLRETGVLTTAQRNQLMEAYLAEKARIGLQRVENRVAGIAMDLPVKLLGDPQVDAPFVTYPARGDSGVQVHLISQPGNDPAMLAGLYEVMQTLEIVPLNGQRKLNHRDFVLMGNDATIASYTYAQIAGDAIKGFTLIWPAGEIAARDRVLDQMRRSFAPIKSAVLRDAQSGAEDPDLLGGISIRQPLREGAGFYVDPEGFALTSRDLVAGCTRITADDDLAFTIAAEDPALGLALLRPSQPTAPLAVAEWADTPPAPRSEIAVAGFPYGGRLDSASVTWGRFAEAADLSGDRRRHRLVLKSEPEDAGGPVLRSDGATLGLLLPQPLGAQDNPVLPPDTRLSAAGPEAKALMAQIGREARIQAPRGHLAPEALYARARDMTMLLSCWE